LSPPHKLVNVAAMRHASLRLLLIAGAALAALPVAAQEAPAPADPSSPAPRDAPAVAPDEPVEPAAIPEVWAPAPVDAQGRSAYGLYLSGRLAEFRGQRGAAATLLTQAEALTPEQPMLRDQTFVNALLAGDLGVAGRLTPRGEGVSPVLTEAGRLAGVVQSWADGDPGGALAQVAAQPIGAPHDRAGLLLPPWLAAAAGDWDRALRPLAGAPTDSFSLMRRESRALLLERRGRAADAEAEFRIIAGVSDAPAGLSLSRAQFLERAGRPGEARAIYEAMTQGATPDTGAAVALARMAQRRPPPAAPTPLEGGAAALSLAAKAAMGDGSFEFAAVYLRMAQLLRPSDETRVMLGYALAGSTQEAAAREAWMQVSPAEPTLYAAARAGVAASFQRDKNPEPALAAWREAVAAEPNEPQLTFRLAGALLDSRHDEEALALLNGPLLNVAGQPFEVRLLRGAALEGLKRFDEAEAELWAALQLRPNDPTALNYLGYLWVDSGRRIDEGAAMIARAHEAEPDNGNYQDSFGWAQYRQGRYDAAVATLESAVAKEPANAEVNDHLGDAYWRAGRRREAAWQWNRVLTLEVDGDRRAGAEKKLAEGLPDPTAPAAG
jgi:tetratricopeptide (TPR) repeat protein